MPFPPMSPGAAPRTRRPGAGVPALTLAAAAAAAVLLLGAAGPARAQQVQWSIGIQLPPVGAVVTRVPPAPAYPVYGPPPTVYVPPPRVIHVPPPVVYGPPHVVYGPPPTVYVPPPPAWGWAPPPPHPHRHRHGWKDREWRDRDRDGVPDRWDPWDDRRGRGG